MRDGGGGGGPPLLDCEVEDCEFVNEDIPGALTPLAVDCESPACEEDAGGGGGGGSAAFLVVGLVISASISATASGPYSFST